MELMSSNSMCSILNTNVMVNISSKYRLFFKPYIINHKIVEPIKKLR